MKDVDRVREAWKIMCNYTPKPNRCWGKKSEDAPPEVNAWWTLADFFTSLDGKVLVDRERLEELINNYVSACGIMPNQWHRTEYGWLAYLQQ